MLSKTSEYVQHSDWVKRLKEVEHAFNNTSNRSTKMTPSNLLFGVNQRGDIVDELTKYLEN